MDQIRQLRFEDFKEEKLEQGYREVLERRWEPNIENEFHRHEFTADAIVIEGGNQAIQKQAPTRAASDALLDQRLKGPFTGDTNDIMYQWASSKDYNPSSQLDKIKAHVLAINSADDERNPPELGIMEKSMKSLANASLFLIPASEQTSGHGTTGQARWWKDELAKVLNATPRAQR